MSSPPLESFLWRVRACADNSTVQCWSAPKGARECSENWGKTCVEPKASAFNEYINYSGEQHQRTVHKCWLASSREWPWGAIPGGLERWNCCSRSVSLCELQVDSSLPGRWLVSGLPEMWKGVCIWQSSSACFYTLPHQTPSLGCFPKCESEAQKGLEWGGWLWELRASHEQYFCTDAHSDCCHIIMQLLQIRSCLRCLILAKMIFPFRRMPFILKIACKKSDYCKDIKWGKSVRTA